MEVSAGEEVLEGAADVAGADVRDRCGDQRDADRRERHRELSPALSRPIHHRLQPERGQHGDGELEDEVQALVLDQLERRQVGHEPPQPGRVQRDREAEAADDQERRLAPERGAVR